MHFIDHVESLYIIRLTLTLMYTHILECQRGRYHTRQLQPSSRPRTKPRVKPVGLVNMMRKYWGTQIHLGGKQYYGKVHSSDCNNLISHTITFIVYWLKIVHRKVVNS